MTSRCAKHGPFEPTQDGACPACRRGEPPNEFATPLPNPATYPNLRLYTFDLATQVETVWEKWLYTDGSFGWSWVRDMPPLKR